MALLALVLFGGLELADCLYRYGEFRLAATEYERFAFFHPDDSLVGRARLQLGRAYARAGAYEFAESTLTQITRESSPLHFDAALELGRVLMVQERYDEAQDGLNGLLAVYLSRAPDVHRLLGWNALLDRRPKAAAGYFTQAGDTNLAQAASVLAHMPRKRPLTAFTLSIFLPGAGEIYAGNIRQGIMSFLVNGACVAWIANSFSRKRYVDAAFVFYVLFNRFYNGSRSNAFDLAADVNERRYDAALKRLTTEHNFTPLP